MSQQCSPLRLRLPDPPRQGPALIHEDEALIVIDKPHWLLSVPGRLPEHQDCALTRLEKTHGTLFVVHRIDCATRGLMLFAKTKAAQSKLSQAFQNRTVKKTYQAWVVGTPNPAQGEIKLPLITDWPNRPKQKVDFESGKPSETHYRVIETRAHTSYIELKPITGRSHQLRIHMSAIGHPILGDRLYAPPEWVMAYPELKLFSVALSFPHPEPGKSPIALELDLHE